MLERNFDHVQPTATGKGNAGINTFLHFRPRPAFFLSSLNSAPAQTLLTGSVRIFVQKAFRTGAIALEAARGRPQRSWGNLSHSPDRPIKTEGDFENRKPKSSGQRQDSSPTTPHRLSFVTLLRFSPEHRQRKVRSETSNSHECKIYIVCLQRRKRMGTGVKERLEQGRPIHPHPQRIANHNHFRLAPRTEEKGGG